MREIVNHWLVVAEVAFAVGGVIVGGAAVVHHMWMTRRADGGSDG